MKKNKMQRVWALVLSAVILLTGIYIPEMKVKATDMERTVFEDDMETKTTAEAGWTVSWGDNKTEKCTESREANQYANNNKTKWWSFKTEDAGVALKLSRTVTGVGAGRYKAFLDADGGNISGSLSISALDATAVSDSEGSGKKQKEIVFGGWDAFETTGTDSLVLTKTSSILLEIDITTQVQGWFDLDNIRLIQEMTAEETKNAAVKNLKDLIDACGKLSESDYQPAGWEKLQTALSQAQSVYDSADSKTLEDIKDAIADLQSAKDGLVNADIVANAGVNVKKVEGITDDFIRGVDISTYVSLIDSGVVFKDWDGNVLDNVGFFKLLKNAGVNYVRIRVWNDPYADAQKKQGYGAGNCDVEKAAQMGAWATQAGLKVMIDFHYSDFWADPGRQVVPKAWKDYTIDQKTEAVKTFTTESLNTIISAGADVGMVQVGNETTSGICGEKSWDNMAKIFDAGCEAVKNVDAAILRVLHFTNPEKADNMKKYAENLNNYQIDYDVFASSYYPYWHGTRENLTNVLSYIADTYNKKVMVAETSWARTFEDGDGQKNVVRPGQNDDTSQYAATYQGQANEVRDVIEAVANVGEAGIGVMYWEPAWLPVNVYDADAENADEVLAANKQLWEKYGSGWASSYSIAYDPNVNEDNYGGSEWDNQAMFDFEGNPLPSLNVFKYVFTGAVTPKRLDTITSTNVDIEFGEDIVSKLPKTVEGVYNDGTKAQSLPVVWNQEDIDAIAGFGLFKVNGTVTYTTEDQETATINAVCTINVSPENLLPQGGFEEGRDKWTIEGTGINSKETENPRTGQKCLAFYSENKYELTAVQSVTVKKSGTYSAFMYLQGGEMDQASAKLKLSNDTKGTFSEANASVKGWLVWQNPNVDDLKVSKGDTLTIAITVTGEAASWGSIDDVFLYLKEADEEMPPAEYTITYELNEGINHTDNPSKYTQGQQVEMKAPTREGYIFEGWYTDSSCTTEFTGITSDTTGNLTLYAKWKKDGDSDDKIKVTEIRLNTTSQTLQKGSTLSLTATVLPEAAADKRIIWSSSNENVVKVSAAGVVTAVGSGEAVISTQAQDGSNVKAECRMIVPFTITYQLNKGSNHKDNPKFYYNQKITFKNPVRKGYTFGGWYTDSKFKKKITGISDTSRSEIIVYAKWNKVTVKVPSIRKVSNVSKKKAKVVIKKVSGAKGYRIMYSTDKKFKKNVKKKETKKISGVLTKLKKGKNYYVKVCAYKLDSKGEKVYGKYSKVKKVKIRK